MLKLLKSCILAASLIAAPLSVQALTVASSLPDTQLFAPRGALQNGETYNFSDGNQALFLIGRNRPTTPAGSFTLTIVNDFVHAGTFQFGSAFFCQNFQNNGNVLSGNRHC